MNEVTEEITAISEAFIEEMSLMNAMEAAGLSDELDQDARDLCRLIQDKAKDYAGSEHGDMTIPLMRSLNRLVQAAKGRA